MQNTKFIEKYFFLIFLITSALLVLIILSPFFTVIVMGIVLATVCTPTYEYIRKHVPKNSEWFASLITMILFILLLGIPLIFLGSTVFNQFQNLYVTLGSTDTSPLLAKLSATINDNLPYGFAFDVQKEVTAFTASLSSNLRGFFTATMNTFFMIVLTLLSMFYFLKDGQAIRKIMESLSPLDTEHTQKIIETLRNAINGIVKGYLLIAISQGILMSIGLTLFGVPHAALWGVVTAVVSLVPTFGTAFVSVPAIIYLVLMGSTEAAVGFGIWALALVGTIDNFLNPLVVGKQTNLPPLVVLFSILGGIALLGPIGILIGPLSISLFRALVSMYREK
jgi:predicted PurR-regulated permease PerM